MNYKLYLWLDEIDQRSATVWRQGGEWIVELYDETVSDDHAMGIGANADLDAAIDHAFAEARRWHPEAAANPEAPAVPKKVKAKLLR